MAIPFCLAFTIQKILTPYDNTQKANQIKQKKRILRDIIIWYENDELDGSLMMVSRCGHSLLPSIHHSKNTYTLRLHTESKPKQTKEKNITGHNMVWKRWVRRVFDDGLSTWSFFCLHNTYSGITRNYTVWDIDHSSLHVKSPTLYSETKPKLCVRRILDDGFSMWPFSSVCNRRV